MCLAVPGKVVEVRPAGGGAVPADLATVDFQGTRVEVSLALVPEAGVGDYVLVHAGYALHVLDEAEAKETWEYLRQAGVEIAPDARTGGE